MWQCKRCGSTERRQRRDTATQTSRSTGCAECHRRRSRARRAFNRTLEYPGLSHVEAVAFDRLLRDDFADVKVTPAARLYLAAFDAYVAASDAGDSRLARAARVVTDAALERLMREDHIG